MAKIKIGINLEFVRHEDKSFEWGVAKAAELGYEYVEPMVHLGRELLSEAGYFHSVSMLDDPLRIKRACAKSGVKLSGLSGHCPLIKPEISVEYLKQVRALCDQKDWLLMIDEVQCGMGRTGKWFAHQWAGIVPDVMPLAKGLGSGVPIGAVVAGPKAATIFGPGNHGTTFGGNPLAMRAGVETLRIMEEDGLMENAERVGAHLKDALARALAELPGVKDIRGQGLMIGVELTRPCGVLTQRAADQGLLISVTADTVIRLVPPLIMTPAEADEVVSILAPLVRQFLAE